VEKAHVFCKTLYVGLGVNVLEIPLALKKTFQPKRNACNCAKKKRNAIGYPTTT